MTKRMQAILSSSDFYTNPSALKGSARLADLFGDLDIYNHDNSQSNQDMKALQRDWAMVGRDMQHAVKSYEDTKRPKTTKKSK